MGKLFLFALLAGITGSPLLALALVLIVSAAGYGYLFGRLFHIPRAFARGGAIGELRRTVALNPYDAPARSDLGRLLLEAGRPREALPHLEAAHARMPESVETRYYLGAARLGAGDHAGGQALIEEALASDPRLRYGEPHLVLADSLMAQGHVAEAARHLEELTQIHGSSVEGRYKLARAYLTAGQTERARAAVEDAVLVYRGLPPFRRREERLWRWRTEWLRRHI